MILKRLRAVATTLPSASASSANISCAPGVRREMGTMQQALQLPAAAVHRKSPFRCSSTCAGCHSMLSAEAAVESHATYPVLLAAAAGGGHRNALVFRDHVQHGV